MLQLDHFLEFFEYQFACAELIRLLLQQHPCSHSHHRFSSQDRGRTVPKTIEPFATGEVDTDEDRATSSLRPRLQFYSDLLRATERYNKPI